jgi:hypothetical protein
MVKVAVTFLSSVMRMVVLEAFRSAIPSPVQPVKEWPVSGIAVIGVPVP